MIKIDDYTRGQVDILKAILSVFEGQGVRIFTIEELRALFERYIERATKQFKEENGDACKES